MNRLLCKVCSAGAFLFLFSMLSVIPLCAATLSNNLSEPKADVDIVSGFTWLASSFRTDAFTYSLTDAALLLANPAPGSALLSLYSANNERPGTFVGMLTSPTSYTSTLSNTSFGGNGLILTPNSTYWLVLKASSGSFDWAWTESSAGEGPGFQMAWAVTSNGGGSWSTFGSEPLMMQVNATPTPEPGPLGSLLLGSLILGPILLRQARRNTVRSGEVLLLGLPVLMLLAVDSQAARAETTAPLMTVASPLPGSSLHGSSISISLNIATEAVGGSLLATLNGKDVSSFFQRTGHCRNGSCPEAATLSAAEGLSHGTNTVRIALKSGDQISAFKQFRFVWTSGLTDPAPSEMSPAYGFTTVSPGGQTQGNPWIQLFSNSLTTGGTSSYPASSITTCTSPYYQILVLDRRELTFTSYNCYADDASFTAALKTFTQSDLVIAGTSWPHSASLALNTTPIGGTDYTDTKTYPAGQYPFGYMIIGVGGAAPGQAAESYVVNPSKESYYAQLNGILAVDAFGYYNFHPSDNIPYTVDGVSTNKVITVGGKKYTPPPINGGHGFWMLRLNRFTLDNDEGCTSTDGVTFESCGVAYDTGFTELEIPPGISALTNDLKNLDPRDLVFLVASGNPFTVPSGVSFSSSALSNLIDGLGGSGNTLFKLGSENSTYVLISNNDPNFVKTLGSSHAVISTNTAIQQGQTGYVYGVLSRDFHNLFQPVASFQDSSTNQYPIDLSMYQLAWTQPVPWPFMDTPSRVAAYRYLSYHIIQNAFGSNPPNVNPEDVRYLYTDNDNNKKLTADVVKQIPFPTGGTWTDSNGTTYNFTQADFDSVSSQLQSEFTYLSDATPYFGNAGAGTGLGGTLTNSNSGTVFTMLGAITSVLKDVNAPSTTNVSANMSNISNLLGSLFSIAAIAVPEGVAPILGVESGLLWGMGSLGVLNSDTSGIPTQDYTILTQAEILSNNYATYLTKAPEAYDILLDNIYTDWPKLSTAGYNVENKWRFPTEVSWDRFTPAIQNSANTYFYLQLFRALYSADFWSAQPVPTPDKIGSDANAGCDENGGCYTQCYAIYPSSPPQYSYINYPSVTDPSKTDIFYLGGAIHSNDGGTMKEDFPPAPLLVTMFGNDTGQLNLPRDLFYSPSGITRRTGNDLPNLGRGSCYDIGGR